MTFNMVTVDEAAAQNLEPAAFLSIARWHDRAAINGDNPGLSRRIAAAARGIAFELAWRAGIDITSRRQERKQHARRHNNDNRGRPHDGNRNAKRRAA